MVVRRFRDYGVLVDANDRGRHGPRAPFQVSDLDVAGVGRPQRGSAEGRAEACVWIGDTGTLRRVRARSCAGAGLWTGSATRRATFEAIDIDRAGTGVYIEHFTRDSTFRGLRIGPGVRVGLNAEWADPGLGPAAGERRQRDRAQPLRELAGRRIPRRGDDAHHRAREHLRQSDLGRRSATTGATATRSTATTTVISATRPIRRHEHLGPALQPPRGRITSERTLNTASSRSKCANGRSMPSKRPSPR